MPIIVSGGDSNTASQRDLRVFALCSLIDKNSNECHRFFNFMHRNGIMGTKIKSGCSLHFTLYLDDLCNLCLVHGHIVQDFFSDNVQDIHDD